MQTKSEFDMKKTESKNKKVEKVEKKKVPKSSSPVLPEGGFDEPASVKREKTRNLDDHKLAGTGKYFKTNRMIKGKKRYDEEESE